ncbi:MAG: 16S rRNA (cytidine(1402)-2'-O)-methyltransferase [Candidatus Bostrichicola ureolyticus]|nr:MAG: 16S rRNA (cytidine(1402)-2'-O)-methyltransferase [Candidatus Bostrichicola ureolyticus]
MLYIVPTPIGNFEDFSFRSIRILKESDLILAENIFFSKKLLNHYNIDKPIKTYHIFNEHKIIPDILKKLKDGKILSLISNAGTPSISDPGYLLIKACIKDKIEIDCLPGATAFVPAIVNSGFPINEFVFMGFLPSKKRRKKKLKYISKENKTIVLYESPHRLVKTLCDLQIFLGGEQVITICRELSKKFQEIIRGTIKEMTIYFNNKIPKGEFVIVLKNKKNAMDI